ncbi:MAG: signal peptide peptidase SppA [Clostridium sp.]|uniref:signal peptide peptidase SppA n=1 Tax=Clostridium sp. TaxID=1506 RepID=UPI002913C21B|nr:signal peptide peptidase SppA [Clostridium sp.]MDU7337700.1 signal peptide peptidase SppA [Clostridium sp.]
MNKKQITGLIAAALVFVFICGSSMMMRSFAGQQQQSNYIEKLLKSAKEENFDFPTSPFVGVVTVEGTIQASSSSSLFPEEGYNHNRTLKLIDGLESDPNNKGILLYVNSPGGGVYESNELYNRLLKYKEKTNRPVWTYMANMAASGGYYISMASDKVIANSQTWTGSIGVIISLSNYKELMDKIGIKSVLFTSGKNKAMGSAGVDMTEEQKQIFQSLVDEPYNTFVSIVAKGRHLEEAKVRPLADGRIYTAKQALENKLIDKIEDYEEAQAEYEKSLGEKVTFYTPNYTTSPFASLFSMAKQYNRSDAEKLADLMDIKESGVPMYYAAIGE